MCYTNDIREPLTLRDKGRLQVWISPGDAVPQLSGQLLLEVAGS